MNALEQRMSLGGGKRGKKERDEDDEEFESMFKTKINWDHIVGQQKKMSKHLEEM